MTATELIRHLQLQPHPEGGFYKEVYRSEGFIDASCLPRFGSRRHYATSIYYLLQQGDFSAFHRIKSDELWHHYAGGQVHLHLLHANGRYEQMVLGSNPEAGDLFQLVIPAGCWFAAEPSPGTPFVLAGCTVAPGFDFADFELADAQELAKHYPAHSKLVFRLYRQKAC